MSYRLLSTEEVILLGQQLENYRRWEQVREFVQALYGVQAHQVTISVMSEYNDESYDEEATIIVTDREGKRLQYDFSLPWWSSFEIPSEHISEFLEDNHEGLWKAKFLGPDVAKALYEFCTKKLGIEFLTHWEPQEPISSIYLIETPPPLSFDRVYVEEGVQLDTAVQRKQ